MATTMKPKPVRAEKTTRLLAERDAARRVLADREAELLDLAGPCSNTRCRLHHAHGGPCDVRR